MSSPPPGGLTVAPGTGQAALNWTPSSGTTSYNVYRLTGNVNNKVLVATVTSTSFMDTGLTPGTTYYYQLTAVGIGGESGHVQ